MSTSLKINRMGPVDTSIKKTSYWDSKEKNAVDAGIAETRIKPIHPKELPTQDNEDSFSNELLNEPFDSLSDIQRSFSSATEESDMFSLSDPVSSPVLLKHDDMSLINITIPTLQPLDGDKEAEDAYSCGEPVQRLYKKNRSSVFQTPQDETNKHPSSVTTVSYGAPETPWVHPACYYPSNPYHVIRSASRQLAGLKYTLSCVNRTHPCPVYEHHGHSPDTNPHDIIIGTRRVEAAVCAFGGVLPTQHDRQNIFRTPWTQYEQTLPSRYTIRDRHISWDVEEHPLNSEANKAVSFVGDDDDDDDKSCGEPSSKRARTDDSISNNSRYKCKLCGQANRNHNCPSSVQRSIGVMVYPAANAYTAVEADCPSKKNDHPIVYSPASPLTCDPSPKRSMSASPFVPSVPLHPEQFRAITPSDGAYSYPSIPLTPTERQRLSDTLFLLSRYTMMEEIAHLLHSHDWDQRLAELLTQVVIGLFCVPGDARLDGLHRYLLSMGISC